MIVLVLDYSRANAGEGFALPVALQVLVLDSQRTFAQHRLVKVGNAQAAFFKGPIFTGLLQNFGIDKNLLKRFECLRVGFVGRIVGKG